MNVLIFILLIWGLCKLINALSKGAKSSRARRQVRIQENYRQQQAELIDRERERQQHLGAMYKARSAIYKARSIQQFFDSYRTYESQLDTLNGFRFRQGLANEIGRGSETFNMALRDAIERQCNDAIRDIRTTYKNSKTYRYAAYNNFCRTMSAYNDYFNDEETRELVDGCVARLQYEYNGAARQLLFHNDAADYERSLLTPKLRYEILQRDGFRCAICGRGQEDGVKLHVDHIKPVSKGGRTTPDNLRTLCQDCNLGKSDSYVEGGYN